MSKKTIKIHFSGICLLVRTFFENQLKKKFDLIFDDISPDFLIFGETSKDYKKYNCTKIFHTAENIPPPLDECDWAFSFDYIDNTKHFRLPLYLIYAAEFTDRFEDLVKKNQIDISFVNRKFCNFIVSNPRCNIRNEFFHILSKYKKVDSGGPLFNNIGYTIPDTPQSIAKIKFQTQYKFTIAFENNCYRQETHGYTTEKILHPMLAYSIPIYWGNPSIHKDFNPNSFINYYTFNNFNTMIDYIIELDKNDNLYLEKLNSPWIDNYNNNILEDFRNFLFNIFEKSMK